MQVCGNCQAEMPADARFCMQCGNPLSAGYTPKHLQKSVFSQNDATGERKQVTVLFADIQRSLDLSRTVGAEAWHDILDRFFAVLTAAIHSYEGTINQYTGDGVMALFGAPIAYEDHARRGCTAALKIRNNVIALSRELNAEYGIELAVRIGLNSGEVVVGRIGDDLRRDYTAQGDTVAIAARLEGLASAGTIYAAEATVALVEGLFQWRSRGKHNLQHSSVPSVKVSELRREVPQRRRFDVLREKGLPNMVGRDHEFWAIRKSLQALKAGTVGANVSTEPRIDENSLTSTHVFALRGETGSGKSRLTYEVGRFAESLDIPVVELRGRSDYKAAPLQPYADLLRGIFGLRPGDDTATATRRLSYGFHRLVRNEPDWQPNYKVLLGLLGYDEPEQSLSGEDFAQELDDLIKVLIDHSSVLKPSLLVIENLHLLRERQSFDELLDRLLASLPDSQLLVIVTYRPDFQPRWQHSNTVVTEFEIKPLTEAQLAEFLAAILQVESPQVDLAAALHAPSGGNPMFVHELLRPMLASGSLQRKGDQFQLPANQQLAMPPSVQSAIAARVDALDNGSKQLLQIAAVIGKEFNAGLLARASGIDAADVSRRLQSLIRNDFIFCVREQPTIIYGFYQTLTREVVYRSQLGEQRRAAHAAVAEAMVGQKSAQRKASGEQMGAAAYHYAEAENWLPAAENQDKAALWYFERDPEEAAKRWQQALEWLRKLPDNQSQAVALRLQVLMRLIVHSGSAGFASADLANLVTESQQLLGAKPAAHDEASLLISLGASALFYGSLQEARQHYESALNTLKASDQTARHQGLQLVVLAGLVLNTIQLGQLGAAINHAQNGLAIADGDTDLGSAVLGRSPSINLMIFQAWALIEQGAFDTAEALLQESLPLAMARRETENKLLAQMLLLRIQVEQGNGSAVRQDMQAMLAAAQQCGNTLVLIAAHRIAAAAALDAGFWPMASQEISKGLRLIDERSIGINQKSSLVALQAHLQLGQGDTGAARATADKGVALAVERSTALAEAECLLVWVAASLARRSVKRHWQQITKSVQRCKLIIDQCEADALLPRWHTITAEAAKIDGDSEQHKHELREAIAGWRRLGNSSRLQSAKDELDALMAD